jgi:membrane fusion protein, multidrug efflux system
MTPARRHMATHRWWLCLLALPALMVGANTHAQTTSASRGPAPVLPQTTAAKPKAVPAPLPARAEAPPQRDIRAQLAPHRYTTLAAEMPAKINRIVVPEGGRFKAGQTLINFDCALQQSQLNKARATLSGSQKVLSANQRLFELNSIGRVELEVSNAEVQKNQAEVATMSTMLSKCSMAAPFSGRVAEQKVREQQFVQAGQALLDILDDSVLEIEFLVPSKWLAWVKAGYPFQVHIDETGKSYPAQIQRIGARVDPVSQSVKLVANITGHFPELIAGMSGKVLLQPPATQQPN